MISEGYGKFIKQCRSDLTGVDPALVKLIFYCGAIVGVESVSKKLAGDDALMNEEQSKAVAGLLMEPYILSLVARNA